MERRVLWIFCFLSIGCFLHSNPPTFHSTPAPRPNGHTWVVTHPSSSGNSSLRVDPGTGWQYTNGSYGAWGKIDDYWVARNYSQTGPIVQYQGGPSYRTVTVDPGEGLTYSNSTYGISGYAQPSDGYVLYGPNGNTYQGQPMDMDTISDYIEYGNVYPSVDYRLRQHGFY